MIYKTLIADGDSNVYQSIKNNNPYREQMITVKKIECTNHLLRNLCKKLKIVAETTQRKRKRGFIQVRNVVQHNILKIRKNISPFLLDIFYEFLYRKLLSPSPPLYKRGGIAGKKIAALFKIKHTPGLQHEHPHHRKRRS